MAQAQDSSRLETGNDGDRLCGPRCAGFGPEGLHVRPVVRELAAAIEADNVSPGYGGCCSAAAQLAAHGDREAAPFVPTTEDQIEPTHKPSSIEATTNAASRDFRPSPKARTRFGYLAAISVSETGRVNRVRAASTVPTASTKQKHNHGDNQNRF